MNLADRLSRLSLNIFSSLGHTVQPLRATLAHVDTTSKVYTPLLAVGLFGLMLFHALRQDYPFQHDPLYYLQMTDDFSVNGRFAFVNFSNNLRGYLFPFMLFLLKGLVALVRVNTKVLFYVYAAVLYALPLVPVLIAISTITEVRFFLPTYLLAYGVTAFGFDYRALAYDLFSRGQ